FFGSLSQYLNFQIQLYLPSEDCYTLTVFNRSIWNPSMYKKFMILIAALACLTACTSPYSEAERLEQCVLHGNTNNNCEISTLDDDE
ncbi:hypothetical protein, partial [Wohlfahrtiimonas chitiniclastica]